MAAAVCGCDTGGAGTTVVDFAGTGRGGAEATAHSRGDVARGLWRSEAVAAGRRAGGGATNRGLGAGERGSTVWGKTDTIAAGETEWRFGAAWGGEGRESKNTCW